MLLDGLIPLFAYGILFTSMMAGDHAGSADGGSPLAVLVSLVTLLLILGLAVWQLMLLTKGTTLGKKMLGMRVVSAMGHSANFLTMLIRETVGKGISGMIFSLGFLWILFDRENQGWHDKLMSTYVVESQS